MKRLRDLPVSRKLTLISMAVMGLVIVLAATAAVALKERRDRLDMAIDLRTIAHIAGDASASALEFNDPASAHEALEALAADPHVLGAVLYDRRGRVFSVWQADAGHAEDAFRVPPHEPDVHRFDGNALDVFQPIVRSGETLGTVYIRSDLHEFVASRNRTLSVAALMMVVALAVTWALSARLQRSVTDPIAHLAGVVGFVKLTKDYSVRALKHGDDELGQLIAGFNAMLAEIESRDRALREARDSLERRVEERTSELTKANDALRAEYAERQRAEQEVLRHEARFRALIENVWDVIAVIAADGRISYISPSVTGFAGYEPEELVGRTFTEFIHPDELESVSRVFAQLVREPAKLLRQERRYRNKRGDWLLTEATSLNLLSNPLINGVVVTLHDITERRRAERQIKQFRDAVEQTSDAIFIIDPASSRVLDGNAAAAANGGYTREELLALDIMQIDPSLAEPAQWQQVVEAVRASGAVTMETQSRRKDGSLFPVEVSCRYVAAEPRDYMVAVVRDITLRRQSESALATAQRELLDVSRQAGMAEVATNVLHNVGNALNSVNVSAGQIRTMVGKSTAAGFGRVVDLLRAHATDLGAFLADDPQGRLVLPHLEQLVQACGTDHGRITAELDSLTRNIDHIKEIVAMQQSYARVGGVDEKVSVAGLVEDCLSMNAESLKRHGVSVVREFADLPPLKVEKHKLMQVLMNLVSNAKYACDAAGRADAHIVVRIGAVGDRVCIEVADNGIGISPENLPRLFEYGFTTRKTGHGFGLHGGALAARSMGGSLTVRSGGPGQGATFTLELPA